MKNKLKLLTVIFSILAVLSCKEKNSYSKLDTVPKNVKNDAHKIMALEVVDGGSYTYINVEENGNKYWMAIPNMEVSVGETYYYNGGMIMKNFESKELGKTFDSITFAEGIRITPQNKSKKQMDPHASTNPAVELQGDVKILPDENGISLAELFTNKENYSRKSVIVRGKVFKVNNAILDKNWVHIKDGTQFKDKISLTVSTVEMVNVGDTVTFKGIVTLEKEVGKGYVYPILLEEGELIQ